MDKSMENSPMWKLFDAGFFETNMHRFSEAKACLPTDAAALEALEGRCRLVQGIFVNRNIYAHVDGLERVEVREAWTYALLQFSKNMVVQESELAFLEEEERRSLLEKIAIEFVDEEDGVTCWRFKDKDELFMQNFPEVVEKYRKIWDDYEAYFSGRNIVPLVSQKLRNSLDVFFQSQGVGSLRRIHRIVRKIQRISIENFEGLIGEVATELHGVYFSLSPFSSSDLSRLLRERVIALLSEEPDAKLQRRDFFDGTPSQDELQTFDSVIRELCEWREGAWMLKSG